ncbi:MAG: [citrate (pro-3S)-lyase] ligase [Deferribacterales bacterium]
MVEKLTLSKDIQNARELIESHGLTYDEKFDTLAGIFEGENLIATGARKNDILKMFVVTQSFSGADNLGEMCTFLLNDAVASGFSNVFLFTKTEYAQSFTQLNFKTLATGTKAVLMEFGNGFSKYIESIKPLVHTENNGAIVMNCNPFTNGHRYLVEQAASKVETLILFVVKEERSLFTFESRLELVKQGTAHIDNVVVTDTSSYAVSDATFPSYFIKNTDEKIQAQIELDLNIFAKKIAPELNIRKRFVGTEPFCDTTGRYNDMMKDILPLNGIELVEIPRVKHKGEEVSASKVRRALAEENYEIIRECVPESTYSYLCSKEFQDKIKDININERRH